MKTILGAALGMLLALGYSLRGSFAQEKTCTFTLRLPLNGKQGQRPSLLEQKWQYSKDPTKEGPFVVRFQFPEGYHVPPHTHPRTEHVTVISGALYLAMGEALDRNSAKKLPAGSFGY